MWPWVDSWMQADPPTYPSSVVSVEWLITCPFLWHATLYKFHKPVSYNEALFGVVTMTQHNTFALTTISLHIRSILSLLTHPEFIPIVWHHLFIIFMKISGFWWSIYQLCETSVPIENVKEKWRFHFPTRTNVAKYARTYYLLMDKPRLSDTDLVCSEVLVLG